MRQWAVKFFLRCSITLFAYGLNAAENSYVMVNASSATVICLGADFLVIPDDPFSNGAITISVDANVGWILTSSSLLSVVPSKSGNWSVKGDEDNPEDRASGKIYVAKVDLAKTRIELLRGESKDIPFIVTPSFAKDHISFGVKLDDIQENQTSVLLCGVRLFASSPSSPETEATIDVDGEKILFRNKIRENRRECGSDCDRWVFCAQSGRKVVLVDKQKKISSFSGYVMQEMAASFEEITSLSSLAREGISTLVDGYMPTVEISSENQMLKSKTAKAIADVFCPYVERSESILKSCLFSSTATEIAESDDRLDESFNIGFTGSLTGIFSGGNVTFLVSPNPIGVSLYNWMFKVASDGSIDSNDFRFEALSTSFGISANGHTATGSFSVGVTLRATMTKEFLDSNIENIGSVPLQLQLSVGGTF